VPEPTLTSVRPDANPKHAAVLTDLQHQNQAILIVPSLPWLVRRRRGERIGAAGSQTNGVCLEPSPCTLRGHQRNGTQKILTCEGGLRQGPALARAVHFPRRTVILGSLPTAQRWPVASTLPRLKRRAPILCYARIGSQRAKCRVGAKIDEGIERYWCSENLCGFLLVSSSRIPLRNSSSEFRPDIEKEGQGGKDCDGTRRFGRPGSPVSDESGPQERLTVSNGRW
jgi:hypothetical protein